MEKKGNIFDMDLNSLMSDQLIDVDASNDGAYPMELLSATKPLDEKDKAAEEANKKATEDANKQMIDLADEPEEGSEEDEEEEDEDTQEEPSSNKTTPQTKSKTSSPLTPYAKLLKDEGILPNMDVEGFDGTADALKEAMVEEIMGAVEQYKQSLPDRVKRLIDNYEEGVPLEKLLEIDKVETDVVKITDEALEEDTSLQRKIVSDYLKRTTKFSETKINKLVEGYEDSGELEDEAKTSLKELKSFVEEEKKSQLKAVQEAKKQEEEQRKKDMLTLETKVKEAKEIIPGIKLNDKVKNNVLSSMTTAVGYDRNGMPVNRIVAARMENPMEFEIKLHYLFEITKGFTDFSKLAEKGKKETVDSFEKAVENLDKANYEEDTSKPNIKSSPKAQNFLKSLSKTYNI